MPVSLAGLGWPSSQKSCSSSLPMGSAPHTCETALTPAVDPRFSSTSRTAVRICSGGACIIEGGSDSPKVRTLRGLKPGSTFASRARLRTISPAPISSTNATRHLRDDKCALGAVVGFADAAAAFLEGGLRIGLRGFPRRHQTEEGAREQREQRSEGENTEVEPDFIDARQRRWQQV